MSSNYKFKDAGKSAVATLPGPSEKIYPRFTVDLDQFPGLSGELDEEVELHLKGRICGLTHNDYSHSMEVEVRSLSHPDHSHGDMPKIALVSIADQELEKLRGKSR